ncbi:MAG: 50S ribosomal protein L10 [Alphaproteobacteria bacterium]|nr:50S ribosomal protein L10 [Alphaproteobacteria bacterium]
MSTKRDAKQKLVEVLGANIKDVELVVVVQQEGLDADQTLDLRRKIRAAGAHIKVGKNTLVRRAIKDTKLAALDKFLKGPTALAFSKDPVAAAKVVAEFAKKNDKLKIVGAALGEQILDATATKALAALPSLDALRGKLVGLLLAPATKIAGVLQAPAGQLARVMSAHSKQAA